MKRLNRAEIHSYLDKSIDELKSHNTPMKQLKVYLIDDLYYAAGKDFWTSYQKEHPNITIEFVGHGSKSYELKDGELTIKETL